MPAKPINLHCAYCKAGMPSREMHVHMSACAAEHDYVPVWNREPRPVAQVPAIPGLRRGSEVFGGQPPPFYPVPESPPVVKREPEPKVKPESTGWPKLMARWSRLGDLGDIEMAEEIAARGIRTPPGWLTKMSPAQKLAWLEENEPIGEDE